MAALFFFSYCIIVFFAEKVIPAEFREFASSTPNICAQCSILCNGNMIIFCDALLHIVMAQVWEEFGATWIARSAPA